MIKSYKVLFVCDELPPRPHGGIGTFVATIAEALTNRSHRVYVLQWGKSASVGRSGSAIVFTLRHSRIPGLRWLLQRLGLYAFLLRMRNRCDFDVCEVPDYLGLLPFPTHRRLKIVIRTHLSTTAMAVAQGRRPKKVLRACEFLTLYFHRSWIGVSQYALDLTIQTFRIRPRHSKIIYCPIQLPKKLSLRDRARGDLIGDDVTISFLGRVSIRKGAEKTVRCFNELAKHYPRLRLVMMGRVDQGDFGKNGERLLALLDEEFRDRVILMGFVPRVMALDVVSQSKVFMFPSCLETFGIVIAEAMLLGVPVIAIDKPPFNEFVKNGFDGILVDESDEDGLVRESRRILDDDEFAKNLSINAVNSVEAKLSVELACSETLKFYDLLNSECK